MSPTDFTDEVENENVCTYVTNLTSVSLPATELFVEVKDEQKTLVMKQLFFMFG